MVDMQVGVASTLLLAFCPLIWIYSIQAEVAHVYGVLSFDASIFDA